MEQIIINKKGGGVIHTFNRLDKAEQIKEFMGQDVVNISLRSSDPITFGIGDWVNVFGEEYKLNTIPTERKINDRSFEYTLQFEGIQYELIKVQILDIDVAGFSTGNSFSLMANLEDFGELIVRNMCRVYGNYSWGLGDVLANTEHKLLDFTNNNCLEVLQTVCDSYEVNFRVKKIGNQNIIDLVKIDETIKDIFRYGRHKGLYSLERTRVSNKNIVTRLFAFGGTNNIPSNYRGGATRLKMPLYAINSEGQPFITDLNAVSEFGAVEGSVIFDDIFPSRQGVVSSITTNRLEFVDMAMPFDLNLQLMPGLSPKVNFRDGDLAGYSFEVESYNHATKKFKIVPFEDERGFEFPSVADASFRISAGDRYVLTDLLMPQSYINEAETRLYDRALDELAIQSVPAVQWALEIDENYIKSKEIVQGQIINYFTIGHKLHVIDNDLRIDGKAQIIGFTRDILRPYKYTLTISEQFVTKRQIQRRNPLYNLNERLRNMNVVFHNFTRSNAQSLNSINRTQTAIIERIDNFSNFGHRLW